MSFRGLVLLLICLAFRAATARAGPPEGKTILTLEKCVEIAVKTATAVLQQQYQYRLTGAEVLQSYGQFLPNLSTNATWGYQTGTQLYVPTGRVLVDSSGANAAWGIVSSLNLFNGLADFSGLRSALAQRNAAEQSVAWAQQQVALDVTQSFLQLVLDQLLLEIAQKNLVASQERLKLLNGQTRVGVTSVSDLYRQQADTSNNQFSVITLESRVANDQTLLVRKLRIDPGGSYQFERPVLEPTQSPLSERPVEQLIAETVDQRSDVGSNKSLLESTDWQVTAARAGYFPRLDLVFQRQAVGIVLWKQLVNGQDALALNPVAQPDLGSQLGSQVQYSIGLFLTWNLFDRFLTHLNIERAQVGRDNVRVNLEDSRFQVSADIRTAYTNYGSAFHQLETARVGLQAAQQSYDAVEGGYEVGSSSIVDVLTAQAALVQSQANQAQALTNLKLQDRTLLYATGKILTGIPLTPVP